MLTDCAVVTNDGGPRLPRHAVLGYVDDRVVLYVGVRTNLNPVDITWGGGKVGLGQEAGTAGDRLLTTRGLSTQSNKAGRSSLSKRPSSSPRSTAPYQMLERAPIFTSPSTLALGAMKT